MRGMSGYYAAVRSHALAPGLVLLAAFASACSPKVEPPDPTPTWFRDVQPIVSARCGGCHVAGGIAPFALTSFEEVKAQSAAMLDAVKARRMPPWMPDEACMPMRDSRRLEQAEIDTLAAWVDGGLKLGDEKDAQALKPAGGLPWVNATVGPSEAYTPQPTAKHPTDDYRCFIVDPQLAGSQDVIGFQVLPGAATEVHHVLVYTVPLAAAQALDDASPGFGWKCFGGPGTDSPKLVGGWVPGTNVVRYPGQTGVRLYAGDVLVMQVHYNMSKGPPVPDLTKIALQYSQNPVPYTAQMMPIVDSRFRVPPSSTGYTSSSGFTAPVDAQLWGVVPHMHVRGKSIKLELLPKPGETGTTCLVDVPKWDFNYQEFYFFKSKTGLRIKADQTLKITCSWDNPSNFEVRWGEDTDDEMCLAFVYATGAL